MIKRTLTHRQQRGDTIVEVLIAIAVVSSVLGIVYAAMNRNLLTMRDNEERTAATKLAQGQIEAVRALWFSDDRADLVNATSGNIGVCVNGTTIEQLRAGVPSEDPSVFDPTIFEDEGCVNGIYKYGVRLPVSASAPNTIFVAVYWDSLVNGRTNQVTYYYRLQ